jgi:hypothetical protein
MLKCGAICSYAQNQALWVHVWAENGSKTAETRQDSRDHIFIRVRPSYMYIILRYECNYKLVDSTSRICVLEY